MWFFSAGHSYTHAANRNRHENEQHPEIRIFCESRQRYFIRFLDSNHASLLGLRSGQEAGSLIDGPVRFLIHYLQPHMVVGNGEHACTKQVCCASDEGKEEEILCEVKTSLGVGEHVGSEKGEEQGR